MLTVIAAILFSSSFFTSGTNSPALSVGRSTEESAFVEICSGVAVSPEHAVTLYAFTEGADVFIIHDNSRIYPDSMINFRDMGLSILIFNNAVFDIFEQPRNTFPETGAALRIIADHPTGTSVIRTFPMDQLADGAIILASPPESELMGAPVFDTYDRLSGIVTGSFDPGDGRGELVAMLPCNLWYFWVERLLSDAGLNTPQFGITAMPATSSLAAVQGILLLNVEKNSPASRCGLVNGDIITQINGEKVYHPEALKVLVISSPDSITLTVQRDSSMTEMIIPSLQQ